jgi:hypothetical protein
MSNVVVGNLYVLGVTLFFVVIGLVMLSAQWRRTTLKRKIDAIMEPEETRSVPLFDTLRYFESLREAGMPEAQAEAMTRALVTALNEFFARASQGRQ